MYIYIHIHIYIYVCICIYVYIYQPQFRGACSGPIVLVLGITVRAVHNTVDVEWPAGNFGKKSLQAIA